MSKWAGSWFTGQCSYFFQNLTLHRHIPLLREQLTCNVKADKCRLSVDTVSPSFDLGPYIFWIKKTLIWKSWFFEGIRMGISLPFVSSLEQSIWLCNFIPRHFSKRNGNIWHTKICTGMFMVTPVMTAANFLQLFNSPMPPFLRCWSISLQFHRRGGVLLQRNQ